MAEQTNKFQLFLTDAFTKEAFRGNSAGVCLIPFNKNIEDATKQKIANEMNLSETAFVKLINEEDTFQTAKCFALQWFTPTCHVSLCGHATLATAAVLFNEYKNHNSILQFETLSGTLKAKQIEGNKIEIDLPAYNSVSVVEKFDNLVKKVVGQLPVKEVVLSQSKKLLIRLTDDVTRSQLESIKTCDQELLAENVDVVGIIVTLKGNVKDCIDKEGNNYDFISRYFAPWMGISEDDVTGSAHSVLAPFWANVLGKNTFYARQCSFRGGELHIKLQEDRVLISGHAVVVVRGDISF
ncbi:hypothetical protein JTE90_026606 [Oedothorax gibbosus]|uniref:Phenazine biosynthesis-like domain-containing protein n=1 Tax=Oedothorax gibbosus TaxID=931172 RepID=A0AAV6UZA5_9ARAC|nr:hypothetical protein JTE90_026606 [Oedothorax gibbosus]